MHPALPFTIAALLFGIGVYGVLVRRNAVLLLMAVELMLNAVNLIFVTADASIRAAVPRAGQSFALFVIVLAAAEIGVGLALILQLYRLRRTVGVDDLPLADEPPPDTGGGPGAGSIGGPAGSDGPDGPDGADNPSGSGVSGGSAGSDEAEVAR
ncbi:NADH-quinone oxidoreductase subunit NuoK [Dactylosporangium sp. NPDC000555]|uniref:NADH-quinone oxidoreductase subunit NuoK n=1 Tax=Dactylosporangium sp. NPDC000555 TaxID=3154260 RepID=UPI003320D14D